MARPLQLFVGMTTSGLSGGRRQLRGGRSPNLVNAVLGAWLAGSALLWPHSTAELASSVVTGAVIVVASVMSARKPKARYAATLASMWLLLSVWVFAPVARASFWNALLVSFAVFFLSLSEPETTVAKGRGPRATASD